MNYGMEKSIDTQDKIRRTKKLEIFRGTKYKILCALRDLGRRGYMIYPNIKDHQWMLNKIYNKESARIASYRGAIYFTKEDDILFWTEGVVGISYSQICYSEGNWSEEPKIVAKTIVDVMRSYGLSVHWDGNIDKKIIVGITLH